jgi:hypothetical protein
MLLAALAVGCGGSPTGDDQGGGGNLENPSGSGVQSDTIAATDVDQVLEAEESINTRCGLIRDQEGSDMPVPEAVRILRSVLLENPEGVVSAGVSTRSRNMVTIVEEAAARLESCGGTGEARPLRQALEEV